MTYFRACISCRKITLLLLLLALLPACEKEPVVPYSCTQPYSDSKPYTPAYEKHLVGGVEVVEKNMLFIGGPRTIHHEVGPLETVWRIARMYDVPPESIYKANGLTPNDPLQTGQRIIIPNARLIRFVVNLYPCSKWKYIIVHHTATGKGNARSINVAHGDRGFWNGLGYHFLIDNGTMGKGDGQIEMSPRWIRQQEGAHCKAGGMNSKSIGIALVGNFNYETPTANQLQSLSFLLATLRGYYHIPIANTLVHGKVEGAKTECPGKLFPLEVLRKTGSGY
jgi:N-acetylmuramoyl-L-alanine amidase